MCTCVFELRGKFHNIPLVKTPQKKAGAICTNYHIHSSLNLAFPISKPGAGQGRGGETKCGVRMIVCEGVLGVRECVGVCDGGCVCVGGCVGVGGGGRVCEGGWGWVRV